ncbi:MAG: LamG-like jellyroll fold domain-containing protein, partial [Phycisphaerae bacterium]
RWSGYVVAWGGRAPRKLVGGRVTCVRPEWKDGKLARQWAYWQTKDNEIRTAPLSDIDSSRVVWKFDGWEPRKDKSTNFQTSADGKRAGATFPWPNNGVAVLPQSANADFTRYGTGCWPQMARDNSYRFFHCSGGRHEWLAMYDASGSRGWWVRIDPRQGSAECPRWANDPRFVACTDRPGGKEAWVYLGKLNSDSTAFSTWVPVCSEGRNSEADVWIADAAKTPPPPHTPDPNAPANVVKVSDTWPGTHDGLVAMWKNLAAENKIVDANGATVRRCVGSLKGLARPTRLHAADLSGGRLLLEKLGKTVATKVADSGEFTVELRLTPFEFPKSERVILTLSGGPGERNLTISQVGRQLVLSLRTTRTDDNARRSRCLMAKVRTHRDTKLAVTFSKGIARAYVDGKPAGYKYVGGDLSNWDKTMTLQLGDEVGGEADWSGIVEAVAFYGRAADGAEIKKRWELLGQKKWWPPRTRAVVVNAELVEKSPTPAVDQLGAYPRALAVYAYKVKQVVAGDNAPTGRILVSHWVVLDGKKLPDDRTVGKTYRLRLEPMSDHPYLKVEYSANALDDFDTPEYYDVAPPTQGR